MYYYVTTTTTLYGVVVGQSLRDGAGKNGGFLVQNLQIIGISSRETVINMYNIQSLYYTTTGYKLHR